MSSPAFIHLRLHTEFSLQDSVVRIPELVERAAALGMPAIAVTDQNNLFAMVKFYREGLKCGVKPIIGVDVLLRAGERWHPIASRCSARIRAATRTSPTSSRAPGSRARIVAYR